MVNLPPVLMSIVGAFTPLFSRPIWRRVQVLLVGALLAPGTRTVASVLRVMGLSQARGFKNYHRVLSRAQWSSLAASRVLLEDLVKTFTPAGPLVMGLDDTLERRRGEKIAAKGIYRDPVRSSRGTFVKVQGLRWLSLMLLSFIPWAQRVWALPILTVLGPSERYYTTRGRCHQPLTVRASQVLRQIKRWLPEREGVVVADSSFSVLELLAGRPDGLHLVTRLRLDAALYTPAPARPPGQTGRPRKKGQRLPTLAQVVADPTTAWTTLTVPLWYGQRQRTVQVVSDSAVWYHTGKPPVPLRWVVVRDPQGQFDTHAFLCTDPQATPLALLSWFVQRWTVEVTFQEARAHLGMETQRQWSQKAIARTTPVLLGLFSLVTLLAHTLQRQPCPPVRASAWYGKAQPTFSDALAWVRTALWRG